MRKFTAAACLSLLMMGGLNVPAHADIDDWLRRTFSTNDSVGDWLRDTFGGTVNYTGEPTESFDTTLPGYREAVEVMSKWKPAAQPSTVKSSQAFRQICPDEALISVMVGTQDIDLTQDICFKPITKQNQVYKPQKLKRLQTAKQPAQAPRPARSGAGK